MLLPITRCRELPARAEFGNYFADGLFRGVLILGICSIAPAGGWERIRRPVARKRGSPVSQSSDGLGALVPQSMPRKIMEKQV